MRSEDKARLDDFIRQLEEVRATYKSQLDQVLDLADRAMVIGRGGNLDASYSARITAMLQKKTAELKTIDALLDAVHVPATPYNVQLYEGLIDLLAKIGDTDGVYASVPGQNPAADQMFAELEAKTRKLNEIVEDDLSRRKDQAFEKEMSSLGFALGLLLFK